MNRQLARRLAPLAVAALALAACGDDGNDEDAGDTGDATVATAGDTVEVTGGSTTPTSVGDASTTTSAGGGSTTTTQAGSDSTQPTDTSAPGPTGDLCTDVDAATLEGSTIAEAIALIPSLSTFTTAVEQSSAVSGRLAGPRPVTVFAPIDDAFSALDPATLDAVLADEDQLTDLLNEHVVAGVLDAETLATATVDAPLRTQGGGAITITDEGGSLIVNGQAMVGCADIEASNGVIHLIDVVLLPSTEGTTPTTAAG